MKIFILLSSLLGFVIGVERTCGKGCKTSFPLHTYPEKESYYACLRGCRLERIDQVSKNWEQNQYGAEKTCEKDCGIAYPWKSSLKNACIIGCKSAQPGLPTQSAMLMEERKKVNLYAIPKSAIHPFLVIRTYCSGLFDVAVSNVDINTAVLVKDGVPMNLEIEVKGNTDYLQVQSINGEPGIIFKHTKDEKFRVEVAKQTTSSWLDCVAYKVGIPKWLLSGVLFISLAAIVYLCCCSCFDSSDEKNHKFDSVFTIDAENLSKVPLYMDDQAPLLPPKYSEKGGIL
eukprot:gene7901-8755_t